MLIDEVRRILEGVVRAVGPRSGASSDQGALGPSVMRGDGGQASIPDQDRSKYATTEERIVRLIERNGGRIEQAEIVSVVDYSAATVSRRLGEMEDRAEIVRYKVGRKKVVCLPGHVDRAPSVAPDEGSSVGERAMS